jgi:hypothetical protein
MASRAIRAKFAGMSVILCVAGGAVHRCAFEDAVLVAILAGNSSMFPVKMERKL